MEIRDAYLRIPAQDWFKMFINDPETQSLGQ